MASPFGCHGRRRRDQQRGPRHVISAAFGFSVLAAGSCQGTPVQDRQLRKDPTIGTVLPLGRSVARAAHSSGCVLIVLGDCSSCSSRALDIGRIRSKLPVVFIVSGDRPEESLERVRLAARTGNMSVETVAPRMLQALNPAFLPRVYVVDSQMRLLWIARRHGEWPREVAYEGT